MAVDATGTVYVADSGNNTIRKVTAAGVVTTLAGRPGPGGSGDGTGSEARFWNPTGVAVDGAGTVYVADTWNYTIRKVTAAGVVTTLAGSTRQPGTTDGTGSEARFHDPRGVAVDGTGAVYVADSNVWVLATGANNTIRKVTATGEVTTLAGMPGECEGRDGTGSAARFCIPSGVAVDGAGTVYVADTANHAIRKVTATGAVTTVAALVGARGDADGTGSAARFSLPSGVAADAAGVV